MSNEISPPFKFQELVICNKLLSHRSFAFDYLDTYMVEKPVRLHRSKWNPRPWRHWAQNLKKTLKNHLGGQQFISSSVTTLLNFIRLLLCSSLFYPQWKRGFLSHWFSTTEYRTNFSIWIFWLLSYFQAICSDPSPLLYSLPVITLLSQWRILLSLVDSPVVRGVSACTLRNSHTLKRSPE